MVPLPFLAMMFYLHWYDRWLQPGLWLILACYASVLLLGRNLIRHYPLRGSYFSGSFFLALCPYLCFSLLGAINTEKWRLLANADQKLAEVFQMEIFGLVNTLVAVALYSVVYVSSRRFVRMDAKRHG